MAIPTPYICCRDGNQTIAQVPTFGGTTTLNGQRWTIVITEEPASVGMAFSPRPCSAHENPRMKRDHPQP